MPDFGAESASLLAYLRLLYSIPPISYVKGSEREDREQADIAALSAIETALCKAAGGRKKSDNGPRLLRTTEIAKRYSLSEAFFNILRSTGGGPPFIKASHRSEEHTSELQSLMRNSYAVFCLKKTNTTDTMIEKGREQDDNSEQ